MNRLLPLTVPLVMVALALALGIIFRYPLVTDDPYITYRYALNLVEGNGFVFNAGERVLSTTTPLYALVLAVFGFLVRDIPATGYWLSVGSFGATAGLLYALARAADLRWGGIAAGLMFLCAPALLATFGLETGFYLMLGTAALCVYAAGRVTLAFVFAALLTLTRSDGIVLVAVLAMHYALANRAIMRDVRNAVRDRQLLTPFLAYAAILMPYLLLATLYFGSPFPFTLQAKIAQAQSGLWDPFARGFAEWVGANVVWLAPQFAFAFAGAVWAIRTRSVLLLAVAWAAGHLAAYAVLGVAFYAWYVAPLFPALCLFAGIGIEVSARWIDRRMGARNVARAALTLLIAAAPVAPELRAAVDAGMLKPSPKVEAYERAAEWIARNAEPDARVDALEVGVIGYRDQRRTYDFVGLVDPMRIPYLRASRFADGVRRRAADYVIAIPPDTWLPGDVWFKDAYRAVEQIRVPGFYSNRPLVIYRRAGAGGSPVETREVRAAFERRIELQSADLYAHEATRGDVLAVRLNLRALDDAAAPEAWKFTLQLVGAENRVIAQTDNYYPARLPEDGKPFADYQGIPIPKDAPPGSYDLILAMYDADTGERLSLYGANGDEVGDFVSLGKIALD